MIRSNRSVIAELLVLIIIVVIYGAVVPSSHISFAQNSDNISDNGSVRGITFDSSGWYCL